MPQTFLWRNTAALAVGLPLLLGPCAGFAQMTGTQTAGTPSASVQDPPAREARVTRSAYKATTYKIGTAVINLAALSYAFGNVVDGSLLAAGSAVTSWAVYTVNDYAWDKYNPAPVRESTDQAFDAKAEAWRTTLKYLTFKPLGLGQKFVWLYAWTGSASMMWTWGLGITTVNTAWFYANDMAWDWYDWYASQPEGARPPARVAASSLDEVTGQGFPQTR